MPEQVLRKWLARIVAGLQKSKYTRFETFITDIVSNLLKKTAVGVIAHCRFFIFTTKLIWICDPKFEPVCRLIYAKDQS